MSQCLFRVRILVLVFGLSVIGPRSVLHAQVLDPPTVQPTAGVQQAGGPVGAPAGAVEQAGWGLSMPKLTMPQVTIPSMDMLTGPFKAGFSKVTSGTKKAWEGTKEMFSFGQKPTASKARGRRGAQQQPSFWQRLLVRESTSQVPQTVGEFMSQPRVDQ